METVNINDIAPIALQCKKELNEVLEKYKELLKGKNESLDLKVSSELDRTLKVDITYDVTRLVLIGGNPIHSEENQWEFLEHLQQPVLKTNPLA